MQTSNWTAQRTQDGAIDYAFYKQQAARLRQAERRAVALRTLAFALRVASRLLGSAVRFWNIPPFGTADRLNVRTDRT